MLTSVFGEPALVKDCSALSHASPKREREESALCWPSGGTGRIPLLALRAWMRSECA